MRATRTGGKGIGSCWLVLKNHKEDHLAACTNHRSADCLKVLDMAHKREILTNKRLCFNCTGFGHMASRCKSR